MPEISMPSTTQVLSDMGLTPNFNAMPERLVAPARERGHRIHAVVQAELSAEPYHTVPHATDATNDDKAVAYDVLNWLDKYGYTSLLRTEHRFRHTTKRYHGQPDWIFGNPKTNREVVMDLKTGSQKCAGHRLQVAGYGELWIDSGQGQAKARRDLETVILYANDKRIEVDRVSDVDHLVSWHRFGQAVDLWWFRKDHGLL